MFNISKKDTSGVVRFKREANFLLASLTEQPDAQARCENTLTTMLHIVEWASNTVLYEYGISFALDMLNRWKEDIPFTFINVRNIDEYGDAGDYLYHKRCTHILRDNKDSQPYDDELLDYECRHFYNHDNKEEINQTYKLYPAKIYLTAGGVVTGRYLIAKPYIKDIIYQPGKKITLPVSYIRVGHDVITTMSSNEPKLTELCNNYHIEFGEDKEIPHYDIRKYKKLNK